MAIIACAYFAVHSTNFYLWIDDAKQQNVPYKLFFVTSIKTQDSDISKFCFKWKNIYVERSSLSVKLILLLI